MSIVWVMSVTRLGKVVSDQNLLPCNQIVVYFRQL